MKTISEKLFELFCEEKDIPITRIPTSNSKSPDYIIEYKSKKLVVEIKQMGKEFKAKDGVYSSTVGKNVRHLIEDSRKQIKTHYSKFMLPSCVIIYNNSDPIQIFGTSVDDFFVAMYGEMTYLYDKTTNQFSEMYYGKNKSFNPNKNRSISAVGHLISNYDGKNKHIYLYPNAYAFLKIPEEFNDIFEITKIIIKN